MRRFLSVLFGLWLAGVASAATHSVVGLAFDGPSGKGWQEKRDGDGILFQLPFQNGADPGMIVLVIGNQAGFSGELNAGFDALAKGIGVMVDQAPSQEEIGVTTTGLPIRWTFKCCEVNGVTAYLTQVAIKHPGGLAYGVLVIIRPTPEIDEAVSQLFQEVVASFDWGAGPRPKVPALPPGTQGLQGLYTRVASKFVINPFGGMDLRFELEAMYFEPNGLFARQPPALEGLCIVRAGVCGSYALNGDTITTDSVSKHFGLVTRKTVPFAPNGNKLKIDGNDFSPIAPSPPLKLNGSWTSLYYASGSSMYSGGSVSITRQIVFTADGRFKRTGFTAVSSSNVIGDDVVSSTGSAEEPAKSGTYAIDGYALALTGDDGKAETLSIIVFDPNDLEVLMIDGDPYIRDKN